MGFYLLPSINHPNRIRIYQQMRDRSQTISSMRSQDTEVPTLMKPCTSNRKGRQRDKFISYCKCNIFFLHSKESIVSTDRYRVKLKTHAGVDFIEHNSYIR